MALGGFEPAITNSEKPRNPALERAATGIDEQESFCAQKQLSFPYSIRTPCISAAMACILSLGRIINHQEDTELRS